jgi:hypothetical protein
MSQKTKSTLPSQGSKYGKSDETSEISTIPNPTLDEYLSPSVRHLGIKKVNSNKKTSLRERRANMGVNLSLSNLSSANGSGPGKYCSF